jgi:hypothetical protein
MQLTPGDQAMTAKPAAPAKAPSEALPMEIAAKHFRLDTLETRNCYGLDFRDVAVWSSGVLRRFMPHRLSGTRQLRQRATVAGPADATARWR